MSSYIYNTWMQLSVTSLEPSTSRTLTIECMVILQEANSCFQSLFLKDVAHAY
jgi:hypothetical protein